MKRNIRLAAIIGILASYLPIWQWDGDQWVGILGLGVISFIGLVATEEVSEMRKNLKEARKRAGLTQQQMADRLNIGLRHYKYIESGKVIGNIQIWDMLEDITGIHQRKLREISEIHPGKEDSQLKY